MTNQGQDQPPSIEQLPDILGKIGELTQKAADGIYIYRGEPECYPLVSSKLYREYDQIEVPSFDIEIVQREILEEAQKFIRQVDKDDILTQLQHYGHPTNLIDFTTDYNIALFFACYSEADEDGRVILLKKTDHQSLLKEPINPENRVIAQRSVFVQSPNGLIEPSDVVVIPEKLKVPIMEYLDKYHGVNAATVFNDIHGFIRYRAAHRSAYVEVFAGLSYAQKEDDDKAIEHFSKAIELNPQLSAAYYNRGISYGRLGNYHRAIQDYNKAIELDAGFSEAYNNRGAMYWRQGNLTRAMQDFSKAIELDPNSSVAYFNRAVTFLCTEEFANAESELSHARNLGFDIDSTFSSEYGSVEEFERDYNVQLPENIRAMLTPKQ